MVDLDMRTSLLHIKCYRSRGLELEMIFTVETETPFPPGIYRYRVSEALHVHAGVMYSECHHISWSTSGGDLAHSVFGSRPDVIGMIVVRYRDHFIHIRCALI